MKKIYPLLFFLLPFSLFSQSFDWMQTVGDIKGDFGQRIVTDKQGNSYVIGYAQGTCNFGANTLVSASRFNFIAMYDSTGTNLWAKKLVDIGVVKDIKLNPLGGIVLVGDNADNNFVRIDSAGNTVFTYEIPVPSYYLATVSKVNFDSRGNYVFSGEYDGYSPALPFLGKMEQVPITGDTLLWNINMNPDPQGSISAINTVAMPDNGSIVMGLFTNTFTAKDIYGDSVVLNATQGILGTDVMWLKYDSLGYLVSTIHHNNTSGSQYYTQLLFDSTSNAFYSLSDFNSFSDAVTKWDTAGNVLWEDDAVPVSPYTFEPRIKINNGYLYAIGGGTEFDLTNYSLGSFTLNQYDLNGNILDSVLIPSNTRINLGDIAFINNSMVLTGGYDSTMTWGNENLIGTNSLANIFIAKIGLDSLFPHYANTTGVQGSNSRRAYFTAYPNPAKDNIEVQLAYPQGQTVELYMSDLLGNTVFSEPCFGSGTSTKSIDVSNISNGLYVISVLADGKLQTRKIVIAR